MFNHDSLRFGDEFINTFSDPITINPNLGSVQILPLTADTTLSISEDTDVKFLYLHVENDTGTGWDITWSSGVASFTSSDNIAAGTHQAFLFIYCQGDWKKHGLGQTE